MTPRLPSLLCKVARVIRGLPPLTLQSGEGNPKLSPLGFAPVWLGRRASDLRHRGGTVAPAGGFADSRRPKAPRAGRAALAKASSPRAGKARRGRRRVPSQSPTNRELLRHNGREQGGAFTPSRRRPSRFRAMPLLFVGSEVGTGIRYGSRATPSVTQRPSRLRVGRRATSPLARRLGARVPLLRGMVGQAFRRPRAPAKRREI